MVNDKKRFRIEARFEIQDQSGWVLNKCTHCPSFSVETDNLTPELEADFKSFMLANIAETFSRARTNAEEQDILDARARGEDPMPKPRYPTVHERIARFVDGINKSEESNYVRAFHRQSQDDDAVSRSGSTTL